MNKVKTDNVFVNKLTCLLNMGAENFSQCRLKQMSGGMIAFCCAPFFPVNGEDCLFANGNALALKDFSVVKNDSVARFCCCGDLKNGVCGFYDAPVSDLSAALAVKRTFCKNNRSFAVCTDKFCSALTGDYGNDLAFALKRIVADKFGFFKTLCDCGSAFPCLGAGVLPCGAGSDSVFLNKLFERVLINRKTFFRKDFLCQVNGETEGILKLESVLAGKNL